MDAVDSLVEQLRKASYTERDAIKAQLVTLAGGPDGVSVREHLESAKRQELLEIQWEIEDVLEATTPKRAAPEAPTMPEPAPAAEEPPPAEPPGPGRALSMKDLVTVYDDPRGLILHKSKVGDRWFATQADPYTGQPQTFELRPAEIAQLKQQLARSPYWVLGAGGAGA